MATAALVLRTLVFLTPLCPAFASEPIAVALERERWTVSQTNFKLNQLQDPSGNGEVVEFLGRKSIRVSKGIFYARDVAFQDGTIEVDMAADDASFFGVAFRVENEDQYEVIFVRPGASGTDQAVQYTPGLQGAPGWQIYTGPGYTAVADIPRRQWIHVRLEVAGRVAKLFLNHAKEPTLTVPDLALGHARGSIGFWGHSGASYFTNLSYTPAPPSPPIQNAVRFQPGTITEWQLSEVLDPTQRDPSRYPDTAGFKWDAVTAENRGMVVINRYRRSPNILPPDRQDRVRGDYGQGKYVFARTVIRSDREEIRRMQLAYSDEVVVFLNGKPLYSGSNSWHFRDGRFLGLLDAENEALYLPLRKGENELLLAVTEYFGGWAFHCRLAP